MHYAINKKKSFLFPYTPSARRSHTRDWFLSPLGLFCFLLILAAPSASAKSAAAAGVIPTGLTRCIKTACVPTQQTFESLVIPLTGLALFEYWGFDLYTAALYAPLGVNTSTAVLSDIPKSLVLHYHRKIHADQIIKAAEHNLLKNPHNAIDTLRPAIDKLHAAFVSVQKGDTYELRYTPEQGTTLLFNGTPQVTLPGVDFQRAYFGIWLSHYSLNSKLTDHLLGND